MLQSGPVQGCLSGSESLHFSGWLWLLNIPPSYPHPPQAWQRPKEPTSLSLAQPADPVREQTTTVAATLASASEHSG